MHSGQVARLRSKVSMSALKWEKKEEEKKCICWYSHPLSFHGRDYPLFRKFFLFCNNADAISLIAQLCPTLCNLMDCSTPDLLFHHQLPEFTQTHVCWGWWCHSTISYSVIPFSCLQCLLASGSFQKSQFFASSGQSIEVSASASVLPVNI